MLKKYKLIIFPVLFVLTTIACFQSNLNKVGNIPTAQPSQIATQYKAETPQSGSTFIPSGSRMISQRMYLPEGGFSFIPPADLMVSSYGNFAYLSDESGVIEIDLAGYVHHEDGATEDEIVESFLSQDSDSIADNLVISQGKEVPIDGITGMVYDVTGEKSLSPIHGAAIVVRATPTQLIFGYGSAVIKDGYDIWEESGEAYFVDIMKSIQIIDINKPIPCSTSSDSTYGYTKDNPIKVGPKADDQFSRLFAYLDNLVGPNGEELSYERLGSNIVEGMIFEKYEITGMPEKVIIYFDVDHYSESQAPMGLSCKGPFILMKEGNGMPF